MSQLAPSPSSDRSDRSDRFAWVDFAKGFCIVAVVTLWITHEYEARGWTDQITWLNRFVWFAHPFRMPDFFLISGLFLSRVIHRPWRHYLDTKVVHYLYFFLLWTAIILPVTWLMGRDTPTTVAGAMGQFVQHLIGTPFAMLWFIMFLSIYFIVTRLCARVPAWVMFPLASLAMIFPLHTGQYHLDRFGMYFVFFYAGHAFASRFFALADWTQRHRLLSIGLLLVWVVGNKLCVQAGWDEKGLSALILGFIGISAVVMLSSLVSELSWARWLTYLGKNSIAVYLGFYLPMVTIVDLLQNHTALADHRGEIGAIALVGSVALSMAFFELANRIGLNFLYQRPMWARLVRHSREAGAHATDAPPLQRAEREQLATR